MLLEPFRLESSLALIAFAQLEASFKFDRLPSRLSLHDLHFILEILVSLGLLIAEPSILVLVESCSDLTHYTLPPFELGIQNLVKTNW